MSSERKLPELDSIEALAHFWDTHDLTDFEDAVQMAAAIAANIDYVVTRNPADFQSGPIPVIQPAALLPLLK